MIPLFLGLLLLAFGLGSLGGLQRLEKSAARRAKAAGEPPSPLRYLAFGLGTVCGLVATVLGAAILVFAYADLAGH